MKKLFILKAILILAAVFCDVFFIAQNLNPLHSLSAQSSPASRAQQYEKLYLQYLSHKQAQPIIKALEQNNANANGRYLSEFVRYLQGKTNAQLDVIMLQKLSQLGEHNLLYELYFTSSNNVTTYKTVHKNFYYKTLLSIGERKLLLAALIEPLALKTAKTVSSELSYLQLLAKKENQVPTFQKSLPALLNASPVVKQLSATERKFFHKTLLEQLLYHQGDYHKLISIIKEPDASWVETNTFGTLKRAKKNLKQKFLGQLHILGYYDAYLKLSETFKNDIPVNRDKMAEAAYLSRQNMHQNKYANISPRLQQKQLFFTNDYAGVLTQAKTTTTSRTRQQLTTSPYYYLALAALRRWEILDQTIVNGNYQTQNAPMLQLLWLEPLFHNTAASRTETLALLQQTEVTALSATQLDYLNIHTELKTQELSALHNIMQLTLLKSRTLKAYLEKNRSTLPPILFEYGMSAVAQQLMEQGKTEALAAFFREYYQLLTIDKFKEKLFYFHAITAFYNAPETARSIAERFLSVYPKSSYRLEIETALSAIIL